MRGTDVVLGTEEGTGAPVLLSYAHRDHHFTVVGDTGTGKTTLLERLIRQDIVDGTACVVFDVHGDMTENLLRFAASQPAWAARTLLVELDPTGADPPFGANLYEVPKSGMAGRAIDGVEAYLRRFWGEAVSGALIESGLTITTRTMVANPGYTMAEVPLLYTNPAFLAKLLKNIPDTLGPDEPIHDYWREYSKLTRPYDREMWRRSLINKLERFLGDELTYPVLAQSRSTIDWEEILGGGYCLLIRLPLSSGERSTEQLNALLLNQLSRHLAARAGTTKVEHRPRVHLYLDEYRRLASEQTTTLLYEARKANVGVTVAMQSLEDLASDVGRDAVLQTATRLAFRTTAAVAKAVAIGFAPQPQQVAVKKGIHQQPVQYLLDRTHPNPAVREVVHSFLGPLSRLQEQAANIWAGAASVGENLRTWDTSVLAEVAWQALPLRRKNILSEKLPISVVNPISGQELTVQKRARDIGPKDMERAFYELNRLLVDVMEGRRDVQARSEQLLDILIEYFPGPEVPYSNLSLTSVHRSVRSGKPLSDVYKDAPSWLRLYQRFATFMRKCLDDVLRSDDDLTPGRIRTRYGPQLQPILAEWESLASYVGPDEQALLSFYLFSLLRLCTGLAKEPIEVAAGPQEERQQTTADVINEVERQLTQLDTGKAYHALLQEDGTINADKITLLPPPPRPPDNPLVIDQIRQRSRQRFSRPRAEIDAATAKRRDTTPHPATSTKPPRPPSPGTRTPPSTARPKPRQPGQQPPPEPPDTGLPPIGRR